MIVSCWELRTNCVQVSREWKTCGDSTSHRSPLDETINQGLVYTFTKRSHMHITDPVFHVSVEWSMENTQMKASSLHMKILQEGLMTIYSPPLLLHKVEIVSAHQFHSFMARIRPQCLSELRWLWLSVPWWAASELVSLAGSHTMPGQHSQPTTTLSDQRCMCV